jgi:hypothetical protein
LSRRRGREQEPRFGDLQLFITDGLKYLRVFPSLLEEGSVLCHISRLRTGEQVAVQGLSPHPQFIK